MSRKRGFKHLTECVNPEYHDAWGTFVTVKDVIDHCIWVIEDRAFRRLAKYGYLSVLLPDMTGKPKILSYIYNSLRAKFFGHDITLELGDEKYRRQDIVIKCVPMSLEKPRNAIPVGWDDNLPKWTWQDVIDFAGYPTGSKDIWPPLEYKLRAQREKVQDLEKQRQEILKRKHQEFLNR